MTNTAYGLYIQGEYAQAEEAFRECLALNPSDPDIHIMLGHCLVEQEFNLDDVYGFRKDNSFDTIMLSASGCILNICDKLVFKPD